MSKGKISYKYEGSRNTRCAHQKVHTMNPIRHSQIKSGKNECLKVGESMG